MKKSISIYCLGGAGINICNPLLGQLHQRNDAPGHGVLSFAMLDSSQANTPDGKYIDRLVLTTQAENANGGGSNRLALTSEASDAIDRFFQIQPPGDLNIVVASAAGATGGYYQNLVVDRLMSQKQAVVPLVIGKTENWKHARNTQLTMANYAQLVTKHKRSLSLVCVKNDDFQDRETCDECIRTYIRQLSVFFGGQSREMDLTDMTNFLCPELVVPWFDPSLLLLTSELDNSENVSLIAAASLFAQGEQEPDEECAYHPVGVLTSDCIQALGRPGLSLSQFFVYDGAMAAIASDIDQRVKELGARKFKPVQKTASVPSAPKNLFGEGDLTL